LIVRVEKVSESMESVALLPQQQGVYPASAAREGNLALPLKCRVTSLNEVASPKDRMTSPDTRQGSAALATPLK
jgi:hypothetical protein